MTAIRRAEAMGSDGRSHLAQALLSLNKAIRGHGVSVELATDFTTFRETVEGIEERGAITPVFDPRHTRIGKDNGFWILGRDLDGQVVHVQAIRHDILTDTHLSDHWRNNPHLYAPPGLELDADETDFNTARVTERISGSVCYHGDFWIDPRHRKLGLAPRLSSFAMLTALCQFSPDYIYAFIVPKHVRRGLSAQYGYLHIHPWAPQWRIVGRDTPYDDYFVWITGDELYELWAPCERNTEVLRVVGQKNDDGLSALEGMPSKKAFV